MRMTALLLSFVFGCSMAGTSPGATVGAGLTNISFTGNIGEILVYDRVLNPREQQTVEHYLMSKYTLGSAL